MTREKSEIYLYCDLNFCDTSLQSFHLERGKLWMWFAKQLPSNQVNILCSSEYRVDWSSTINYCPDTIAAPVLKFDTKSCISNFLPSLPQFDTNVINCQCCAKSRKLMCFWCQQSFKNMDVDCKAVSYCSLVRVTLTTGIQGIQCNKLLRHRAFLTHLLTTRCREIITNSNFAVKNKLDSVIYRSAGKLRTERVYCIHKA